MNTPNGFCIYQNENDSNRIWFSNNGIVLDGIYPIPYKSDITSMEGGFYRGQLDNILSVSVLYSLLAQENISGDVLFTIGEEAGLSGKRMINFFNDISYSGNILALDVSPVEEKDFSRGDVVLRGRDSRAHFDGKLTVLLEESAKKENTAFYYKDKLQEDNGKVKVDQHGKIKGYGLTEMGDLIFRSQGKYTGTTFQIPVMGDGSDEITTLDKTENFEKVLKRFYSHF